jgi:hypothetical protein
VEGQATKASRACQRHRRTGPAPKTCATTAVLSVHRILDPCAAHYFGIRSPRQRLSTSSMILSAHRTASAIALIVAGTLAALSNCASFLAARIEAMIAMTRLRPSSIGAWYHSVRFMFAPSNRSPKHRIQRRECRECLKIREFGLSPQPSQGDLLSTLTWQARSHSS